MDFKLELIIIPVSDVDRAKEFYLKQAGFELLVDTPIGDGQRIVQLTPPGSAKGLHLVVSDVVAARELLVQRGTQVSEVRHVGEAGWAPGPHPERASYSSFAEFTDPDGNLWLLQEVDWSQG
jgi:catechol 2,3-dioxygenase-like lactoylglutathione lyase family enzyme